MALSLNAFAVSTPYDGTNVPKALVNEGMDAPEYSALVGKNSGKAGLSLINADGANACRTARFTYDVSGGADSGSVGVASLGVSLPANSIIRKAFFYSVTTPVSAGAGTVAFSCEDANNLFSAAAITGWTGGTLQDGAADETDVSGAITSMTVGIAAECEIVATVASAAYTAGKVIGFVDYCAHD